MAEKVTVVSGVVGQGGGLFSGGKALSGPRSSRPRSSGRIEEGRSEASKQAWFSSRGITDTTPVGRTTEGALLYQTRDGKVISTTDMSLLTQSGEQYVSLTTKSRSQAEAEVEAGVLSPQALGREPDITPEPTGEGRIQPGDRPSGSMEPYKTYYGDYIEDKPTWKERIMGSWHQFEGSKRIDEPTLFSDWNVNYNDVLAPSMPYQDRGTIQTGLPTDLTYGDISQREKLASSGYDPEGIVVERIRSRLTSSYQKKVDTGELTVEQAEKDLQKSFEEQTREALTRRSLALSYKTKVDIGKELGIAVKGGAIVGGLAVAPVLTGSILMGTSGVDVVKGTGIAVGGTHLTSKERWLGGLRAGIGVAGIGIGARASFGSIERSIVSEQLKTLSNQPVSYKILKYKGGKVDIDIVRGTQSYQGLKTEFDVFGVVKKLPSGKYVMGSGYGKATTTGELSWNILSGRTGTNILSVQKFSLGAKGFSFRLGARTTGTLGKGTLIPEGSTGALYTSKMFPRTSGKINFPSGKGGWEIINKQEISYLKFPSGKGGIKYGSI